MENFGLLLIIFTLTLSGTKSNLADNLFTLSIPYILLNRLGSISCPWKSVKSNINVIIVEGPQGRLIPYCAIETRESSAGCKVRGRPPMMVGHGRTAGGATRQFFSVRRETWTRGRDGGAAQWFLTVSKCVRASITASRFSLAEADLTQL